MTDCDCTKDLSDFSTDTKICGRKIHISKRFICIDELIYKTFKLLNQLAVFVDLGIVPSLTYHDWINGELRKQRFTSGQFGMELHMTISFAHIVLGIILNKLKESGQISDVKDFVQIISKLQQSKEE